MRINKIYKIILILLVSVSLASLILFLNLSKREPQLNVLLITLDALRADHLGCYGYKRNTSPNIDSLAKEGVLFAQAITQVSWTGSLVSLLTSTYPSTHKIEDFGTVLNEKLFTLAEILKKRNYSTACTSGGNWISKDFPGLGRGFDYFFDASEINRLVEQVIEWMIKFQNRNFFIWIHFFDYPHAPYLPPTPYNKLFISYEGQKNVPIGKGLGVKGFIPDFMVINNISDVNFYISQYDGEIAYVDKQIGKILNGMKNLNLYKDTLIIISADHGESLGEHDYYFQHGYYLYDQLLKVPLIIKGPMIPRGKIISQQVQLIDITPTILSLLKIKINSQVEGTSLVPVIFGRDHNRPFAFSESSDGEEMNLKSIRTMEWKLIYNQSTDKYELYNLKIDPEEINNLVKIEKVQFEFLKEKLEEWINRSKPDIKPLVKPLDEETKERLKSLGYLQ